MSRTTLRCLGALAGVTALRFWLIGRTDLIPDEAYYAVWADRLDVCYWDQPGGIAFWNALMTAVFGRSDFALRAGAIALSLVSTFFTYDLGRTTLRDERLAALGALLAQFVPLLSMGAVLILHDTLLGAALSATMALVARAWLGERPRWWYAAAAVFTVALYAKFSAVILVVGAALFLIAEPSARRALRRGELWIGAAGVAVAFTPVIAWNARHGWVAYKAVTKLSTDVSMTVGERVTSLFDYFGSQLALVTPILLVLMMLGAREAWRDRREKVGAGAALLACWFIGFFAYFAAQALRAKVQGNWAAMAYVPGSLLAVRWMAAHGEGRTARRWSKAAIGLAATVTLLIHAHSVRSFLPIPPKIDPTAQAHGWKNLAGEVERQLSASPPGTAVLTRRYQVASELRFYLPGGVDVFCATHASRGHQFDLWQDFDRLSGRDVIYVDYQGRSAKLFLHFKGEEALPPVTMGTGRATDPRLNLWRLREFSTIGPLQSYFRRPFEDALERLEHRIEVGREG